MDEANPEYTDTQLEQLFEDTQETSQVGNEDATGKSEGGELSLSDINAVLKRDFTSKEDALKSIEGLRKLVGDQTLAKERKESKQKTEVTEVKEDSTAKELAELKKTLATKDFLIEVPTAKESLDIIEAYAEKNNMTLTEAWATGKFNSFAESSQKKVLLTNNRINPVHSQQMESLSKEASSGNQKAQETLVAETLFKNL